MEVWYTLQTFEFDDVSFLSKEQLLQHYDIYKQIIKDINRRFLLGEQNADKLIGNRTLNSLRLHELYFSNLGGRYQHCKGDILRRIEEAYGSYSIWEKEFKEVGLAVASWAILAADEAGTLHIFGTDSDEVGIWGTKPLLVMDVSKHAFQHDFSNQSSKYINLFIENINWFEVERRLRKLYGSTRDRFANIF